ncbi:MAG: family 10 glycosylhydrolase [Eubacteriales bacterium]|nr:family 10 glycosylhydrolase [Eubacteriales bacterium]
MKKLFVLILLFLALTCGMVWYSAGVSPLTLLHVLASAAQSEPDSGQTPDTASAEEPAAPPSASPTETRAIWVATAYAIDYPSNPTTDVEALKTRCNAILDAAKADGCNTIYLQVRPAADALYPSDLFPWSRYLTGTCGTAPADSFDPLAYWLQQAHARSMKLEAWVNPYRICAGQNAASDFASLPDSSPAKQHPDWVVTCDGSYYFNPGLAEVRQMICDGIREIVETYDVDGIQFDDYFYPSTDFNDADTYAAAATELSRDDWRRDNVNQLVQMVYQTVHEHAKNPVCVFGISPSGIWRNKGVNAFGGSDTNGYEHYSSAYADSLTWIKNGWIDYICPQIYWEIGDTAADFDTLARWWARQVDGTNVDLILGLAAYKIGDAQYGTVWQNDGCAEIGRQLNLSREISGIRGCAVFSCRNLEQTAGLDSILQQKWTEQ